MRVGACSDARRPALPIGAVYLNFIGDEGQDWVVAGFGREHDACLAMIKARDAPDNVFHVNHAITPSGAG